MMRRSRFTPVIVVAAALSSVVPVCLAWASGLGAQTVESVFPAERWERARGAELARLGWNPERLGSLREFIRDSANTTGLVVVDRGRVVYTYGDVEQLSYLASVRKSLLAMLYGDWVERGIIDLDATLADLAMDDVGGLMPVERDATVGQLITARSGVYHPASNGGDNLADAPPRGSRTPGTYMLYNNWDFNAAGAAFEQLTGRSLYDEFQSQIAIPIGLEHWDRSLHVKSGDLSISRNPAYHFHLSTLDMARVGYLMLHEGEWNGEQVIDRDWARRIVSVVTPLEEMNPTWRRDGYFGYGTMWWVWDGPAATGPFEGAYTARGAIGQWITVLPAVDLVIAHKTASVYGRTTSWESWQRMLELALEAHGLGQSSWPWSPGSRAPGP